MEKTITYISVDKIYPHPDNPRKELGDLSELAESIKAKGIFQNLTLVPRDGDTYTVIIGHRRLSAAKLAGLDKVPCAIVEMSERDQLATMLLENMQRADLTVFEQAQGFQMMIDLGESVKDIADKTGFSETTVRRRTKLASLSENVLKRIGNKQISFGEIDELFKIDNAEIREKVAATLGTNNFRSEYQKAISEQNSENAKKQMIKYFQKLGMAEYVPERDQHDFKYEYAQYGSVDDVKKKIGDRDPKDFRYEEYYKHYFRLYPRITDEEKSREAAQDELRKKKSLQRTIADDVARRAFNLRLDFIKNYSEADAKKNIDKITLFELAEEWEPRGYHYYRESRFFRLAGLPDADMPRSGKSINMIKDFVLNNPHKALLINAYVSYSDSEMSLMTYDYEYKANRGLEWLYDMLIALGYEMSDEERSFLDGTHPCYKKTWEE